MKLYNPTPDIRIIEELNQFIVFKDNPGYTIWNRRYPFEEAHAHTFNLENAKFLIICANIKKLPPKYDSWLYQSYHRVLGQERGGE